uniref:Protein-serine O-palmitoleoyltransferase porcupine n=1 Tax=Cacopsylla melanoneura TaxID=428564 RepID=A0A8D9E3J5_9HEMI
MYDDYDGGDEYDDEYYDNKHIVWGGDGQSDTSALADEYENFSELADPRLLYSNCLLPTFETAGLQLAETLALCAVFKVVLSRPAISSSVLYRNFVNVLIGLTVLYRYFADLLVYIAVYSLCLLLLVTLVRRYRHAFVAVLAVSIATITSCELFLPHFILIRSVFMLMSIKMLSLLIDMKTNLPLSFDMLAYMFNPGTVLFGPFVSYKQFLDSMEKPAPLSITRIGKYIGLTTALLAATCAVMPLPTGNLRLAFVYRDALNFRVSHYFISYMSLVTYSVCGYGAEDSVLFSPLDIELPYSLKQVTYAWNRPLSTFLNRYIFKTHAATSRNIFFSLFLTYVVSCGLHGFNLYISQILLSLAVYSYIEYALRAKLAHCLDACIRAVRCPSECAEHAYTDCSARTLLLNGVFLLCNVFHLAYLGCVLNNLDLYADDPEYKLDWIPTRWSNMGYASPYVVFVMYIVYIVL